ncbi:protein kinase [Rhodopseudomonas sp. HC1]|uniref:protein kinase domain-containing protein n=1 Tax=Rhodopseudomonas infernalis TaxID=2897386 RepID=UPI001EE8D8A2|nr:protein kinase [Rhodopseudomonas infernalis]MCG6205834.1 protein kinase [Rhodopseudomonas infernalis]
MSAAEHLAGMTLDGGWTVVSKIAHVPSSGGMFSVPYIVEDKSGKEHFLKALDFSEAFNALDPARELQNMTSAYNHERDVLEHCRDRRLSRVVLAVTHGYAQVPNFGAIDGRVAYLIFELAESDVRKQVDLKNRLDCLISLSILNDVTLGMMQLHRETIAHQDLKPSNVLTYADGGCRVGDFGRSARRGYQVWMDNLVVAGDRTYAPPEHLYSNLHPDFVVRRIGCDLYLLGNLAAFLFSGINVTAAVFSRLDPAFHPTNWNGTYDQVLPHLQHAFSKVLVDLENAVDSLVQAEIATMVRELCNPDIARRGHRKGIGSASQFSLERYKSYTDLLLKRTTVSARSRSAA